MTKKVDLIVIGGGAAGFFAAITAKQTHPNARVVLLEKNAALLSKVRISGGGRCNVTHGCFEPRLLVKHYPRGQKELLGSFHTFQCKDTMQWFESRGVALKTERDGRVFPTTDHSQTIIDCLLGESKKCGVEVLIKQKIESLNKVGEAFELCLQNEERYFAKSLILATGSSPKGHEWAKALGHKLIEPVPSLFTFNTPQNTLKELSGIAFKEVSVKIKGTSFSQNGPLLITHFGFSGPCVLKLSAWAARVLHEKKYEFEVIINWLPESSFEEIKKQLLELKKERPKKKLLNENLFQLPKNFWRHILRQSDCIDEQRLHHISLKSLNKLTERLHAHTFQVQGKTTHKEEFVTCGGVHLKEVNFNSMESKICPGLFFAGEILDIDGVTGGFNFQNAWTTGYIAGKSVKI